MLNFSAHLTEHCTRSKSAWPGDRELFFSRPKLNVSRLRRPGAVRAQPWPRFQSSSPKLLEDLKCNEKLGLASSSSSHTNNTRTFRIQRFFHQIHCIVWTLKWDFFFSFTYIHRLTLWIQCVVGEKKVVFTEVWKRPPRRRPSLNWYPVPQYSVSLGHRSPKLRA